MAKNNSVNSENPFLQIVSASTGDKVSTSTTIPYDNSIPQNTEGTEILTLTITPKFATSKLDFRFTSTGARVSGTTTLTVALFQDATANALAAKTFIIGSGSSAPCDFCFIMTSGTTSATTFKIRAGGGNGHYNFNGETAGRAFGGVSSTTFVVTEYL
jgi:hypothetical protein